MADISKLKKMRGLDEPPSAEEARVDLAPVVEQEPPRPIAQARPSAPISPSVPLPRIDARSLRRSGRTVHFATKVTPAFDNRVRELAAETGDMLTEILEKALAALEREMGNR
jgi:hypothetical protein